MKTKKILKFIKDFFLLFLLSSMLVVPYEKIQCRRMIAAIENNNIKKLEWILKFTSPNCVTSTVVKSTLSQKFRHTPLGEASEAGNFEVVKLLVENGADVNYFPINTEASPLGFAVQSKSIDTLKVVKFLLENGADVNYSKYGSRQPACMLLNGFDLPPNGMEILKVLMEAGADPENEMILQRACYYKHEEAIRYLIEEWGYDASDPYYLRAYCYGVDEYSYETFEYFLEKGANPYEKDEDGMCAIDYLIKEPAPEWAEKLIKLAESYGITAE